MHSTASNRLARLTPQSGTDSRALALTDNRSPAPRRSDVASRRHPTPLLARDAVAHLGGASDAAVTALMVKLSFPLNTTVPAFVDLLEAVILRALHSDELLVDGAPITGLQISLLAKGLCLL